MTTIYKDNVTGLILAGGKARRMRGVDKGLITINGQPMIRYVLDILKPQVHNVIINANRNIHEYETLGCEVISDQLADYQGPLAGIATAMNIVTTKYICTCPCDGPLVANDLASRLFSVFDNDETIDIAVAHDGKRLQPVYALINCELRDSLLKYLNSGERKIDRWYAMHNYKTVDFSDQLDCFININTPEDQKSISQRLLST